MAFLSSLATSPSVPSYPTLFGTSYQKVVNSYDDLPRRSANYQPSIWDDEFLQSLKSDYMEDSNIEWAQKLKETVRLRFDKALEPLALLELIDNLQRLGLGYHFENEIKGALESLIFIKHSHAVAEKDLYCTALYFRLLRQHNYQVSQDVFISFKDEMGGGFKACISENIKGMLSLYEASYYAVEGETILDEAQEFTAKHLKEMKGDISPHLAKQVGRALEIPLHWRVPRLQARWYIDWYETKEDMDPLLLELAKLDFNTVQAIHQQDLMEASKWWRDLGLRETMNFARDRLVEHFFAAMGLASEPQLGFCRKNLTKVISFIILLDDIYDVYGTLDELELFTDAVKRWDINTMEVLPDYMKKCLLALFNTTNKMAYEISDEQGCAILPYLKKAWTDLCKSFLEEAKWYYNGYEPTIDEYINNGWISSSGIVIQVHAYFLLSQNITEGAVECLKDYPDFLRCSSLIFRFINDLGTSKEEMERGDSSKSVQCYMRENNVTEEAAHEHIKHLIAQMWKKLNKDLAYCYRLPHLFISSVVNILRMAQCLYQYGNGHGNPRQTKGQVLSVLLEPIPTYKGID